MEVGGDEAEEVEVAVVSDGSQLQQRHQQQEHQQQEHRQKEQQYQHQHQQESFDLASLSAGCAADGQWWLDGNGPGGSTGGSTGGGGGGGFAIPNIVHFVLADKAERFFDWTMYLAVVAARDRLKPEAIYMHLLDGVEPYGDWFQAAKPLVTIRPFARTEVPAILNGEPVAKPAHVADFKRLRVLYEQGGIYMDTDHVALRSYAGLRRCSAVFGRGPEPSPGQPSQVQVGCIMASAKHPVLKTLLDRMTAAFDGGWVSHSINAVNRYFVENEAAAAAAAESTVSVESAASAESAASSTWWSGRDGRPLVLDYPHMFPFSWRRPDLMVGPDSLFEGSGYDWSSAFAMHLYHSQSEGISRYIGRAELAQNDNDESGNTSNNFAAAVALAVDDLDDLLDKLDNLEYLTPHVDEQLARKRKLYL